MLILSETTSASSFKIQHDIALDSPYISTGDDVPINLTIVSILVQLHSMSLDNALKFGGVQYVHKKIPQIVGLGPPMCSEIVGRSTVMRIN